MYFLTNKEGLVIAASNNFLSALGSRDVCSISNMLHDKLITINESNDKLEISNKELVFNYSKAAMYSAFGELTIYNLSEFKESSFYEEDENIAYLKKIKEGSVIKSDNEYDIPDIPVLHKNDKEFIEGEAPEITESNRNIQELIEETEPIVEKKIEIDTSIDKLADEIVKAEKSSIELEANKLYDTSKKAEVRIDENKDSFIEELKEITPKVEDKEVIESIDIVDAPEVAKALEEDFKLEEKNVEASIKEPELKLEDDAKEILKEIKEVEAKESIVEKIESIKETGLEDVKDTTKEQKESLDNNTTKLVDNIEQEAKEEIEKSESAISKIKKKLFPWGKKNDTIELEDKDYEIDLKTANEIEPKKDSNIETVIDKTKEIIVEPEITASNLEEDVTENREVNTEDELINENIEQRVSEPVTIANEEIIEKVPELNKQNIDDESKILNLREQIEKIEIQDNKAKVEIEEDKEQINEKETIKEPTNLIKEEKDLTITEEPKKDKMVYKILASQVDAINLNDNANKLSIDYSSYKMLLENYLDEIEKYNNDLINGSSSTINMLTDAGELLSLNVLIQKLNNLKNVEDKKHNVNEINLICSLIKEKLSDSQESLINVEKEENIESIEEEYLNEKEIKPVTPPVIPDEVIEITTAEDLLSAINKQIVAFNPNRAADELNLPKGLIIEFVEDFLAQSKEHLSVIVNAYNSNDIKTIQTTAHMLKGAASNLRLDTIAETLFKIQKESNLDKDASLIKNFVAQIKGLEEEIASVEDAEDEN